MRLLLLLFFLSLKKNRVKAFSIFYCTRTHEMWVFSCFLMILRLSFSLYCYCCRTIVFVCALHVLYCTIVAYNINVCFVWPRVKTASIGKSPAAPTACLVLSCIVLSLFEVLVVVYSIVHTHSRIDIQPPPPPPLLLSSWPSSSA